MSLTFDEVDVHALTPMMRQHFEIKAQHPDCLIFFRLGDFFELFFDDALTASRELEIALTGRDCGLSERAPMCGVPHHAADQYIKRLLSRGYKVAVCDQVEDPALAKGLVDRQVVRVITPGTQTDPEGVESRAYQYICSVFQMSRAFGFAACDLSSGRFETSELLSAEAEDQLFDELSRLKPVEFVVNEIFSKNKRFKEHIERLQITSTVLPNDIFDIRDAERRGLKFTASELLWPRASTALLYYLESTQMTSPDQIGEIQPFTVRDYMLLDRATRLNLELVETIRDRKRRGSLLWAIDRTKTSMGSRLLRAWIEQPLIDRDKIEKRQSSVAAFHDDYRLRSSLQEALTGLYDIERLSARIASGQVNPRDLSALRTALRRLPNIKELLDREEEPGIARLSEEIFTLPELCDLLESAIVDDPPVLITDGGIIRRGFNAHVDELLDVSLHGKDYILSLEAKERETTGIRNLKIGYNRVFGYYFDITKSQLSKTPDHFQRLQTLANSERFATPELKELESKIVGAEQRRKSLEYELFSDIRSTVTSSLAPLQSTARALAMLDVLLSLAETAERQRYCRPTLTSDRRLNIKKGRHPVVELMMSQGQDFVANDLNMDGDERRLMILTGPNMSGKSTYMRQTALIVLLAQIGSFVPAESAEIGIVDRIMTRVGASDDLGAGQSTFMVEMSEVASILNNATVRSLLILDEVGRGTGTADGLSIAWSVIEYIADPMLLGARALFATHYHELIDLGSQLPGTFNCHVDVAKDKGEIIFLHVIRDGGTDDSYGIEVARLAGVPDSVVLRASEIMEQLEKSRRHRRKVVRQTSRQMDGQQDLFSKAQSVRTANDIVQRLRETDVDILRPVDAFGMLIDLKALAERHDRQQGEGDAKN
ncbi:MAG: DNA mismatch repair protein MutS [Clostridiaceae bacterium]|mgnify:CR=1 FL=1|jgi:DNA mismatch repair protein MutS|nr:DNA mismatch repair protein MutS [Clostridiaceae bacterium]